MSMKPTEIEKSVGRSHRYSSDAVCEGETKKATRNLKPLAGRDLLGCQMLFA
jgi:hypothetical protein